MKKILSTVAALLVMTGVVGLAWGGWNIKQNDDGSTSWVNVDGDAYPVARAYLTVNLENLGTASTTYVSVPYAGSIFQVDSVVHGDVTTASETLTVSIMSEVSPGRDFMAISTKGDSGADVDATIIIYFDRDQSQATFR